MIIWVGGAAPPAASRLLRSFLAAQLLPAATPRLGSAPSASYGQSAFGFGLVRERYYYAPAAAWQMPIRPHSPSTAAANPLPVAPCLNVTGCNG